MSIKLISYVTGVPVPKIEQARMSASARVAKAPANESSRALGAQVDASISALRVVTETLESQKRELTKRATDLEELGKIVSVLSAMMTKMTTGSYTAEDHNTNKVPSVRPLDPDGTQDIKEYIRTILVNLRPAISSLYRDRAAAVSHLSRLTGALSLEGAQEQRGSEVSSQEEMNYEQIIELIDEED